MMKFFLFAITMFFSSSVYASPNQIEIIGLIPGLSTQAQVENTDYVIGGYRLECMPEYIDGLLSQLVCFTGKDHYSRDTTNENSIDFASNIEVHDVLAEGFTKKFGIPSQSRNVPIQNRLGAKFNPNIVTWEDKKGNTLTLLSIASNVDQGAVFLQSAQKIKMDELEKKAADKKRKF